MIKKCALFFCLVTFISCGNKDQIPPGILKADKMQAVLWDIIRVDAVTAKIIQKDSSKNVTEENLKLQQQVFAIHKVSKDIFYKSYDYYKANPGQMKVIMDSMIIQAERNRDKNYTIKRALSN